MTITIVGSLKMFDELKECEEWLRTNFLVSDRHGLVVHSPVYTNEARKDGGPYYGRNIRTLYQVDRAYLEHLESADLVVAVPKKDGTFGESTTYEIAMAHHFGKTVMIYKSSLASDERENLIQ